MLPWYDADVKSLPTLSMTLIRSLRSLFTLGYHSRRRSLVGMALANPRRRSAHHHQ